MDTRSHTASIAQFSEVMLLCVGLLVEDLGSSSTRSVYPTATYSCDQIMEGTLSLTKTAQSGHWLTYANVIQIMVDLSWVITENLHAEAYDGPFEVWIPESEPYAKVADGSWNYVGSTAEAACNVKPISVN